MLQNVAKQKSVGNQVDFEISYMISASVGPPDNNTHHDEKTQKTSDRATIRW